MGQRIQDHQVDLISSFFLLPSEHGPLILVAWSLIHELWFYLAFSLLLLFFPEKRLLPALLIWAFGILGINVLVDVGSLNSGWAVVLHPLTLEFIFGAMAGLAIRSNFAEKLPSVALKILAAAALVAATLVFAFGALKNGFLVRALVFGSLYGLLVLSTTALEFKRALAPPRFLIRIGDASYTIYLSHVLILSAIGRLWMLTGPGVGFADNGIALIVMLFAVLAYGLMAYRLIENPLVELSHRLRQRLFPVTGRPRATDKATRADWRETNEPQHADQ